MPTLAVNHPKRSDSLVENRILHQCQRTESRASTDWPAPTCAAPSKVVRKRGRRPSGTRNQKEFSVTPARPYWKGYLKLSLVSCPIAIYTGTSATERVSFRQINKKTGRRLRQQLVDEVT